MAYAGEDEFEVVPATREDIDRLAEIHVMACLSDNAFKLYFATAAEFKQKVVEMLDGQVGEPPWKHVKVVEKASGTLAAWASWHTPPDEQLQVEVAANRDVHKDEGAEKEKGADEAKGKKKDAPAKGEFNFPEGLASYVQADTDRWLARSTRRRRHIQCKALFTDPLFQRRGMASALVRYGNAAADTAGLPMFLQASPYGYPIYSKYGFDTMQYLNVDLREWAPKAKRGDKGFGNYRFRYMVRLPETLPYEEEDKKKS